MFENKLISLPPNSNFSFATSERLNASALRPLSFTFVLQRLMWSHLVRHGQVDSHVSPYYLKQILIDLPCDFTSPSKKSWGNYLAVKITNEYCGLLQL